MQLNFFKDVILNTLFIQNEKIFVIYRNPISPYLTEKVTFVILFFCMNFLFN